MDIFYIITFLPIIILIFILFWISNKEIKKSLEKTRISEKMLEEERSVLITRIENQSTELKKSEESRMNELSKVAEFGRLSQGLFHDLMTPLSSIVLHTEKLKNIPKEEIALTQKTLEKAIDASRRMGNYIQNIRNAIQNKEIERSCYILKELRGTIELLSYKARLANVEINIEKDKEILWFGDPLKLRQIFSNLISNSIDSFESIDDSIKKVIRISCLIKDKNIILTVKDNGIGISTENLGKIFNPFFTTKSPDKGTGIGLATVKSVVREYLHGKIEVESIEGNGTIFLVTFPSRDRDPGASLLSPHTPLPPL